MLKSRMLGKPLVRFCEGRGGNRILSEFPKHPVYSTSSPAAALPFFGYEFAKLPRKSNMPVLRISVGRAGEDAGAPRKKSPGAVAMSE